MTPRVLVAVISGGRPLLGERRTAKLLPDLAAAGFPVVEWMVREDHAVDYERDEFPVNAYPLTFDDDYSRTHWLHPNAPWEPGGFHGAFPGREWAMRQGEERGFDMVLQLDDNIDRVGIVCSMRPASYRTVSPAQVLTLVRDVAWATNVSMAGIQLDSVVPGKAEGPLIRPGFPYSVFFEKVGPGRMPWFGPYEDDIMHAMEYGLHGGPHRTAALLPLFRYHKEAKSKSGMRRYYDPSRGLELVRRYPANAKLKVTRKSSSPRDLERGVRHIISSRGFTPVRVSDPETMRRCNKQVQEWAASFDEALQDVNRAKIRKRAGLPADV